MRKKRTFLLFVLLYVAVLAVIAAVNTSIRLSGLRSLGLSIERRITADGTILDLRHDENDTIWLREISPDGKLISHIPLPARTSDDSPVNYHILSASDNKVYLHTYTRPYGTSGRSGARILVCDMLTRKYSVLYQPQDLAELNLIGSWAETAADGGLYFGVEYRDERHSIKRLKISYINKETGGIAEWLDIPLPFLLTSFAVTEQGGLFAASADSSVYRYGDYGWARIFKAGNGRAAAQFLQGGDGTLYLFMTGYEENRTNRLLRLAPSANAFVYARPDIADCSNLSIYDNDTMMALTGDYAYKILLDGETYEFSTLDIPFNLLWDLKTICYILAEAALMFLLIGMIRHLWLKRKNGLILKLLAVSVPVFALGCFLLIQFPLRDMRSAVEETIPLSLLSEASEIAGLIDGERFAGISRENPWGDSYYLELRDWLESRAGLQTLRWWGSPANQILDDIIKNNEQRESGGQESRLHANYRIYRVDGNNILTAICGNGFINVDISYLNPVTRGDEIDRLLDSRQPVFVKFYDGEFWLALLYPITDKQGNLTGILEISRQTRPIERTADSITGYAFLFFTGVSAAMMLPYILVTVAFLRNLNRLKHAALAVSGGNYGIRIPVTGKDDVGDIAAVFNDMAGSVERNVKSIKAVGDAYGRFVPDEMLPIFQRDSITEINTTDYASLMATFLLLTTESFDSYRDEAYLDAVNDFYTCILPVLSGGGALVERFTANELRALFNREPLAALNTALDMFSALNRLNKEFEKSGQKPVECGVLLAFSESFLGIAGYSKRLNIILQSRYSYKVNSVRAIGIRYGCRLLLEQRAFEGLGKSVSRYRHRLLGYILDNGERCAVYDFYDGEPVETVHCKDITRERFIEAVGLYYAAQYDKARSAFIEIIQQTPNDLAAREYLKKSHLRFGTDALPDNLLEI